MVTSASSILASMAKYYWILRSCFEFLQKVFLDLMYPRQIARYLPHHRSENASKTHPKSSHDKFKTAS